MKKFAITAFAAAAILGAMAAAPAWSAESAAVKACSDQWAQMKKDGKVPAGQKWSEFEKTCVAQQPASGAAAPATPAAPPKATTAAKPAATTAPAATGTAGKDAEHAREKTCAAEWDKLKAANKTAGQTWPQYWHDCDTKLKAAGQ